MGDNAILFFRDATLSAPAGQRRARARCTVKHRGNGIVECVAVFRARECDKFDVEV